LAEARASTPETMLAVVKKIIFIHMLDNVLPKDLFKKLYDMGG